MKSRILSITGVLLGAPTILAGKGLQHTGKGMVTAGTKVIGAGEVTEALGAITRASFDAKAHTAAQSAEYRRAVRSQSALTRRLDQIQAQREETSSTAAVLALEEEATLRELAALDEVLGQMPEPQEPSAAEVAAAREAEAIAAEAAVEPGIPADLAVPA